MDDAIGPATRGDVDVLRGFSRAFHMIDDPADWLKRPSIFAKLMAFWAMPQGVKRARGLYPPSFGPTRREMLAKLDIAA